MEEGADGHNAATTARYRKISLYFKKRKPNFVPVVIDNAGHRDEKYFIVHETTRIAIFLNRLRSKKKLKSYVGLVCMVHAPTGGVTMATGNTTLKEIKERYGNEEDGCVHLSITQESVFG